MRSELIKCTGPVLAGDSITSTRVFTLILCGTIPVIINDRLLLPFESFLDWSSFALFIPERQFLYDPTFNLGETLAGIPLDQIRRMQKNLEMVKKHFVWHEDRIEPGDVIDMLVSTSFVSHETLMKKCLQVREMALGSLKMRTPLQALRRRYEFGEWAPIVQPYEDRNLIGSILEECEILDRRCDRWASL